MIRLLLLMTATLLPRTFSPAVYRTLLPRPAVAALAWAEQHVPAPSIIQGNLRFDLFPYMREVLECLDSPEYDVVTLQFAARTGKTTGVQAWLLKEIAANPHNCIWAEPDEPSLKRVLRRTWTMIDACPPLAVKAAPPRRRSNKELKFEDCVVFGGYSGSPSTAADEAAFRAVLNELDKFSHRRRLDRDGNESGEADFPDLVRDRTTGWAGSKVVQMSTPSIKGRSRIEAERLNGDRRRYYVPCPHCSHFQTLKTGRSREEPGGIKFAHGRDGKLDIETARATAWYECEKCRGKILDEHRYAMFNAGKWLKEGQSIDKRGRIRGTPLREGRHASFGPLGTHYSLLPSISWGWIAAAYVADLLNPLKTLQNYLNSVEGETYDPAPPETTPHELAERLRSDIPRGQVPGAGFTILAADTGVSATQLIFYWMVTAWDPVAQTGHVVDWGICESIEELDKVDVRYQPLRVGIDSGGGRLNQGGGDAVTDRVYEITRARDRRWWPLKGSSAGLGADWYVEGFQRSGLKAREVRRKRRHGLGDLLVINTTLTQSWRKSLVEGRVHRGDNGFVTLPAEVAEQPSLYADFLDELCSDYQDDKGRWTRRGPNEYGDVLRYSRVLAELAMQGGKLWGQAVQFSHGAPVTGAVKTGSWFSQQARR